MAEFIAILCALSFPPWEATEIADACKRNGLDRELWPIVAALRKTENGGPGREFGILDKRADTYRKQAGWAAYQVKIDRSRWSKLSAPGKKPFLVWFSAKYAPLGAKNDPGGLNSNHYRNLVYWTNRIQGEK